ncbi:hypothetical protein CPS_4831 [Colwellia psychrerythraea 34H]|uniref:Uncharacterized protein n=1 Tax=Colwellia psychrerythraea (strain 34H / ATCC BAA-681) TaxID=167879 RepID=Q47UQ2_COLP3|nr:hypothetical protein CPS_4831 [Colwellia psychrerythraea 34H]
MKLIKNSIIKGNYSLLENTKKSIFNRFIKYLQVTMCFTPLYSDKQRYYWMIKKKRSLFTQKDNLTII